MKYFVIVLVSLLLGFLIGKIIIKTEERIDYKIYVPGEYKIKRTALEIFGLRQVRRRSKMMREKSNLKQLGTTVAMYYSDGGSTKYPSNPNVFEIDDTLFRPRYLTGTYIEVIKNWKIPDNWYDYNHSKTPFVFVRSPEDNYTGSADTPMFITRYGYQAGKDIYQVVYEDGHVSSIYFDEAVELWKKAGVWNGE